MAKSLIVKATSKVNSIGIDIDDVGILKNQSTYKSEVYFIKLKKTVQIDNNQFEFINPNDYGDSKANKICNVCHRILPTEYFDKNQNGKDNRSVRRPSCKDCRKVIDGVNMTSQDKKKWTAIKPNLTEFTCPICKKTTIPGLTSKVVLNHDHNTGKVYGWICDSCNTGLGRFKDDVNVLQEAIKYLEDHQ